MSTVLLVLTVAAVVGLNFMIWAGVGMLRWLDETLLGRPHRSSAGRHSPAPGIEDVAVLMAAHDEELVIGTSLDALRPLVPSSQTFVVSDGSSDATVSIAERAGANVISTPTNVGKASALAYAIERFGLVDRFEVVMLLDADTQLAPDYFEHALPLLADQQVVAVAGCAQTRWNPELSWWSRAIVVHRQRVYQLTQLLLKYGQTWRAVSATHIVPGFASLYRTRVLPHIDIAAPGMVIEDFNMTFEVHRQRLGRIAFHPLARAYTQDPSSYRDYCKQTRRWALGLWQTVRRHRWRLSVFCAALLLSLVELVMSSVMLLLVPLVALLIATTDWIPLSLPVFALAVLVPDYLCTCLVAAVDRRPTYLLAGLVSLPLRLTDAYLALLTLPLAWTTRSTGTWKSPERRQITDGPTNGPLQRTEAS